MRTQHIVLRGIAVFRRLVTGTARVGAIATTGTGQPSQGAVTTARRIRVRRWSTALAGLVGSIAVCVATTASASSISGPVEFVNTHSGLCMSVPGDNIYAGAPINQYDCGGYRDQHWMMTSSDSHHGWFYIQPQENLNLCVTYVPRAYNQLTLQNCGSAAANGNVNTMLWDWSSDSTALLTIQGWAMSIPGASMNQTAPVNTYPLGPYPDQDWYTYYF